MLKEDVSKHDDFYDSFNHFSIAMDYILWLKYFTIPPSEMEGKEVNHKVITA
jgi:hypothetical protein